MATWNVTEVTPPGIKKFLRFGGISILGWFIDSLLFFALVQTTHVPVFSSNVLSASAAAVTVFLISRQLVFKGSDNAVWFRTLLYYAYTLVVILAASVAISYVTDFMVVSATRSHLAVTQAVCAFAAKLLVTPFNFILNFVVARFLSEYAPATIRTS